MLKTTISESDHWKRAVEGLKIGEKQDLLEISVWNTNVDAKLAEADGEVYRLQKWLDNKKHEMVTREDQLKLRIKLHETKLQLQAELQDAKPVSQSKTSESTKGLMAKLLKARVYLKFSSKLKIVFFLI